MKKSRSRYSVSKSELFTQSQVNQTSDISKMSIKTSKPVIMKLKSYLYSIPYKQLISELQNPAPAYKRVLAEIMKEIKQLTYTLEMCDSSIATRFKHMRPQDPLE